MAAEPDELNQRIAPVARRPQELRSKVEGLRGAVFYPRLAPPAFPSHRPIFGETRESEIVNMPSLVGRISRQRQARAPRRR